MLKQKEILTAVISLLKTKYPAKTTYYYTDEITEGFKQPCFFIKLIKTKNVDTKNTDSNSLSIVLTYFSNVASNKQLIYLDCEDNLIELFGNGFNVSDRYLHIQSISSERIGEEQDILQVIIAADYLDSTGYNGDSGYNLMQQLNSKVTNKHNY